jgi:hypothetical protein
MSNKPQARFHALKAVTILMRGGTNGMADIDYDTSTFWKRPDDNRYDGGVHNHYFIHDRYATR